MRRAMRDIHGLIILFCAAAGATAQNNIVTFEEPGLVAMPNTAGAPVPILSQVTDQFLGTLGVRFMSSGGFVAVVNHGPQTPSAPNIIGATSAAGNLDYGAAITATFWLPSSSSTAASTSFVQVRGDLLPNGGTVFMSVFAADDTFLGTVSAPDGPPAVLSFTANGLGVHRVVLTASTPSVGFDNFEFASVRPAALHVPYGVGCPGAAGTPFLQGVPGSPAVLGGTLHANVINLPSGVAWMIAGLSRTQSGPFVLPLDLTQIGMPGCSLQAELLTLNAMTVAGSNGMWTLAIPPLPSLAGTSVYHQALAVDLGGNALGLVVSNAAEARLGW